MKKTILLFAFSFILSLPTQVSAKQINTAPCQNIPPVDILSLHHYDAWDRVLTEIIKTEAMNRLTQNDYDTIISGDPTPLVTSGIIDFMTDIQATIIFKHFKRLGEYVPIRVRFDCRKVLTKNNVSPATQEKFMIALGNIFDNLLMVTKAEAVGGGCCGGGCTCGCNDMGASDTGLMDASYNSIESSGTITSGLSSGDGDTNYNFTLTDSGNGLLDKAGSLVSSITTVPYTGGGSWYIHWLRETEGGGIEIGIRWTR